MARLLPVDARVSASSALYSLVSQRESVYVFPATNDANYVFLDVVSGSAPTSAGDVYLRVQSFLESGEWSVAASNDGVLLLQKSAPEAAPAPAFSVFRRSSSPFSTRLRDDLRRHPNCQLSEWRTGPGVGGDGTQSVWRCGAGWATRRAAHRLARKHATGGLGLAIIHPEACRWVSNGGGDWPRCGGLDRTVGRWARSSRSMTRRH